MENSLKKILRGYRIFKQKYAAGDNSVMQQLSHRGQNPETMIISCCDSRVDPALILQCNPGDLFVVRNVANIIPPYEKNSGHHGTSAALEFGICYLKVKHLIILGHSQCGGIQALLKKNNLQQNDFITDWVSLAQKNKNSEIKNPDEFSKQALLYSYENCLSFPWIKERIDQKKLMIHLWFFDIKTGNILTYSFKTFGFQVMTL